MNASVNVLQGLLTLRWDPKKQVSCRKKTITDHRVKNSKTSMSGFA